MLAKFENYLKSLINDDSDASIVDQAMAYALLDGGKRIRPLLLFSILQDFNINPEIAFPCASSLEMIHTYSLVHDDLPAMDNDRYRRGKLTDHCEFGEDIAILAGDALLTKAFSVANNIKLDPKINLRIILMLANYSGNKGMIYGQELDLRAEGNAISLEELKKIHFYKTGKLIILSLLLGIVIAEKEQYAMTVIELGEKLGLAFQLQDDILEITQSFSVLGKENSDIINNKVTYISLLGLEEAENNLKELFVDIYQLLKQLNLNSDNLFNCIKSIENRSF